MPSDLLGRLCIFCLLQWECEADVLDFFDFTDNFFPFAQKTLYIFVHFCRRHPRGWRG